MGGGGEGGTAARGDDKSELRMTEQERGSRRVGESEDPSFKTRNTPPVHVAALFFDLHLSLHIIRHASERHP